MCSKIGIQKVTIKIPVNKQKYDKVCKTYLHEYFCIDSIIKEKFKGITNGLNKIACKGLPLCYFFLYLGCKNKTSL